MLRMSHTLIVFAFVLFASPQAQACMGPSMEDTLFFNANDQPLFIDRLGQEPLEAKGLVEFPPDADLIAEVTLINKDTAMGKNNASFRLPTAAKIEKIITTTDSRVRQGDELPIKFSFSSCGPNHINGDKGTILAKVGTDIEDKLVLCMYSRRFGDGRVEWPDYSDCSPLEIETAKQTKLAAEKGDMKAQIALGSLYEKGKNARQDNVEAMKWFRLAAESEDAEAQYALGSKYRRDQNATEAVKWYKLAVDQGHAEAMYELGQIYEYGSYGVKKNTEETVKWYKLAAAKGHAEAIHNLGRMYMVGADIKKDYSEAEKWYRLGAENDDAESQFYLGTILCGERLDDCGRNKEEALKWFTRSSDNLRYSRVRSLAVDPKSALVELKKSELERAAKSGGAQAQYELGYHQYYHGSDRNNRTEAINWLKLAAEQGHGKAINMLGGMNGIFSHGKPNPDEEVKWYRLGAEKGDAESQYNLGGMYQSGWNGKRSYEEAVKWYRLSAEQGYGKAQYDLGLMYQSGNGVEQNIAEAVKWFTSAAEQGDLYAIIHLAEMYLYGRGVDKNYAAATKWFGIAAEKENRRSKAAFESLGKYLSTQDDGE
jgi:FOG: TPR repeat, SEL1 subfamily